MLGVMIGVASVIAMLAIGQGAQEAIQGRLASLGTNMVMIFGGAPSLRGVPGVVSMYPEAEGNVSLVNGDKNWVSEMQGVTPAYESIRAATPYTGRFFTAEEDERMERVVLLGSDVARRLFGEDDPVGRTIELNHAAFRVLGVMPVRGAAAGDMDDQIFVPVRTAMRRVLGTVYLHRLAPLAENDFVLRDMSAMRQVFEGTTRTMSLLLGVGVSLALSSFAGWAAIVTPGAIATAFGFSAGVGVLFGFWPARKASLLSPIEAPRYE